jgi:hypothetical protein
LQKHLHLTLYKIWSNMLYHYLCTREPAFWPTFSLFHVLRLILIWNILFLSDLLYFHHNDKKWMTIHSYLAHSLLNFVSFIFRTRSREMSKVCFLTLYKIWSNMLYHYLCTREPAFWPTFSLFHVLRLILFNTHIYEKIFVS